jgi:hypothetical protein
VDEVSDLYRTQDQSMATHLALRWKGRVRYTIPHESAGQQMCWKIFRPGKLGLPLRAMARLPRLFGSTNCGEGAEIASMREATGGDAGLSCCRAGSEGSWTKETVLLLNKKTIEPLFLVKTGAGTTIDSLLQNEADWLRKLQDEKSLADHVPELVALRSGEDRSFIAQSVLLGKFDMRLGDLHLEFLKKLQRYSLQSVRYEDSVLYRTLNSRLADLDGSLPEAWSTRIETAMKRIEESLSDAQVPLVAAHNDFNPWNIGLHENRAYVFDWEFAANGQMPLFDPLHFVLMPLGLWSRPTARIVQRMHETLQLCQQRLGKELCYEGQTQALAYLVNLCTLYLGQFRGASDSSPLLGSYGLVIDQMCRV